jgi:hypothetical protein
VAGEEGGVEKHVRELHELLDVENEGPFPLHTTTHITACTQDLAVQCGWRTHRDGQL